MSRQGQPYRVHLYIFLAPYKLMFLVCIPCGRELQPRHGDGAPEHHLPEQSQLPGSEASKRLKPADGRGSGWRSAETGLRCEAVAVLGGTVCVVHLDVGEAGTQLRLAAQSAKRSLDISMFLMARHSLPTVTLGAVSCSSP